MGCDIHCFAERKIASSYDAVNYRPLDWRDYGLYGFLAGVRNYSAVPPISEPRGLPDDTSAPVAEEYDSWRGDAHSASWLSVEELLAFDYDRAVEDRRVMRNNNGGSTAEPGGGKMTTFREFLGEGFFRDLEKLRQLGAARIVFWFDN